MRIPYVLISDLLEKNILELLQRMRVRSREERQARPRNGRAASWTGIAVEEKER